jgi:hypothetical protein
VPGPLPGDYSERLQYSWGYREALPVSI